MKKKSPTTGLTDFESNVLAVIWRNQPTTAYRVRHSFSHSPVRELALSQGSIYPAVERLKIRGYIGSVSAGDARQTEHLTCTEAGEAAVKAWLFEMPVQVPADPLRSKIVSLSILDDTERELWLERARAAVSDAVAAIEEFSGAFQGPFHEMAHDNARSISVARLRWLDRVEAKLSSES